MDEVEDYYCIHAGQITDTLNPQVSTSLSPAGILPAGKPVDVTQAKEQASFYQLTRLDIPVFNEDLLDWPNFHGMFVSLVYNNTSLSKVLKLQLLKHSIYWKTY